MRKTESTSLGVDYAQVPMGSIYGQSGSPDLLSLLDGGIECLKQGHVLVSAYMRASGMTDGDYFHMTIYKNGVLVGSNFSTRAINAWADITIPPVVVTVAAGDIIHIYACNTSEARGTIEGSARNVMTVQYLD